MIIQNIREMKPFDEVLAEDTSSVQPISIMDQGEFVAIIQWDGTGEDFHFVLVPKGEVKVFVADVEKVGAQ